MPGGTHACLATCVTLTHTPLTCSAHTHACLRALTHTLSFGGQGLSLPPTLFSSAKVALANYLMETLARGSGVFRIEREGESEAPTPTKPSWWHLCNMKV